MIPDRTKHVSDAKLIMGILASGKNALERAHQLVITNFGTIDLQSDILPFDYTDYYKKEMGDIILRQYISFEKLIYPGKLSEIKLLTNKLEDSERSYGKRTINLDPGYLTLSSVVLATTKEAGHRVYLGDGIYGQAMLYCKHGSFRSLEFTYPDYVDDKNRTFFYNVRSNYQKQICTD